MHHGNGIYLHAFRKRIISPKNLTDLSGSVKSHMRKNKKLKVAVIYVRNIPGYCKTTVRYTKNHVISIKKVNNTLL